MSIPWSLVCLAGLWGFIASTIGLILTSFPAPGVLATRPFLRWGSAVVVCFVFWLLGMANA